MIAKLFISLLRLSPWLQRALWRWWYQRLAKRATDSGWTFMNYGYSSINDNSSLDLKPEDEVIAFLFNCTIMHHRKFHLIIEKF